MLIAQGMSLNFKDPIKILHFTGEEGERSECTNINGWTFAIGRVKVKYGRQISKGEKEDLFRKKKRKEKNEEKRKKKERKGIQM